MHDRLFLPETISDALDTNLANGLRAIADALDSGQLSGRHLGTIAAAGPRHDERIHLRVSLDLAAEILQTDGEAVLEQRGELLFFPSPPPNTSDPSALPLTQSESAPDK